MKTVKAQVPEGVRDVTGQEAFAKRALEQRLQTMFVRSGFEEIITPSLEYAELFEGEVGNLRQDRMIRLFEQDGKMMTRGRISPCRQPGLSARMQSRAGSRSVYFIVAAHLAWSMITASSAGSFPR